MVLEGVGQLRRRDGSVVPVHVHHLGEVGRDTQTMLTAYSQRGCGSSCSVGRSKLAIARAHSTTLGHNARTDHTKSQMTCRQITVALHVLVIALGVSMDLLLDPFELWKVPCT